MSMDGLLSFSTLPMCKRPRKNIWA